MMSLSRRSFLATLLSSAAVIAAGPVAKVVAPATKVGGGNQALWLAGQGRFLEGMSQQIAHTIWYGVAEISPMQFGGLTPIYNSSIDAALSLVPDGFNVLDGGAAPPYAGDFDDNAVAVGTFPRNSRAGMTFRLLE